MLYIVGTPIGNLEDTSLRQARTIASSDIILAEDTRSAHTLLEYIKKSFQLQITALKIIPYYKEKEFERLPGIIEMLEDGKNISLISESGMPLISDPGYLLVQQAIRRGIPFTVIPGPTADITALVHCGFELKNYVFFGFLPKKKNDVIKTFEKARQVSLILDHGPVVFYESPNRINESLRVLDSIVPSVRVCVCRELTKKFEEVVRGIPKELSEKIYRGEIVLI